MEYFQIQMEEQLLEEQLNDPEDEGESQIIRGENLPIVDLKKIQHKRKRSALPTNQPNNRSNHRRKESYRRDN